MQMLGSLPTNHKQGGHFHRPSVYMLALETSCDESAAAVLHLRGENDISVIAEEISSQAAVHEAYGGVVPELASREHLRNLPYLVDSVLRSASVRLADIGAIAVTRGPGLVGCLLVGLGFAKGLALAKNIPFLGVNHIEGHLFSCMLEDPAQSFPFLALVVSGGHTEVVEVRGLGRYKLHARTSDDAAGEAFDKSAHLLGFPYPGGAALAALADSFGPSSLKLPRVMREAPGFSFSGLKTAIALKIKEESGSHGLSGDRRAAVASAVQEAIVDALVFKLAKVVQETGIRSVALVGGVSANRALQKAVASIPGVRMRVPSALHCTDNAAMIGYVGALRSLRGEKTDFSASALSRWPVENMVFKDET